MQQLQAPVGTKTTQKIEFDSYARLFLFLRTLRKLKIGRHLPEQRYEFIDKHGK